MSSPPKPTLSHSSLQLKGISPTQPAIDPVIDCHTGSSSGEGVPLKVSKLEPVSAVPTPLAHALDIAEQSHLAQLPPWLNQGCSHAVPSLPPAFEVDWLQLEHNNRSYMGGPESTGPPWTSSTVVDRDHGNLAHTHGAESQPFLPQQEYVRGLRRDIFQHLMEVVCRMCAESSVAPKEGYDSSPGIQYRVRGKDLENIVAHVVQVMGTLHHASMLSLRNHTRLGKPPARRLIVLSTAVLPQAPRAADTATTITLPQTCITYEGLERQLKTPATESTTATLVAHNIVPSITEISWATNDRSPSPSTASYSAMAPGLSADVYSRSCGRHGDTWDAGDRESEFRDSVHNVTLQPQGGLRGRRTSVAGRALVDSCPPAKPSSGTSGSSIVSFPALTARHCTNDLSSPVSTPTPMGRSGGELYDAGIDAHTGLERFHVAQPAARWPDERPSPLITKLTFNIPAFAKGHGEDDLVPKHQAHRLGSSIGTSAGRKRSNHSTMSLTVESGRPSMLQKLRRGSAQLVDALSSAVGGSHHTQRPQPADQRRRASSVDRITEILGKAAPPTTGRTEVGRKPQVEMIARSETGHGRCDPCSQDGRPHICVDETGSSVGS
jgi:hypothetical protein